jgi:CopA family copper-resistance protein
MNDERATPTRRRFLQGIAAGGVVAAFGSPPRRATAALAPPATLAGNEFELTIGEAAANFTGKSSLATVVNGTLPAPLLQWREGDTVTLRVRNDLDADTSIHWHGIVLPFDMDGVPGVSFHGIAPGETFTYRFDVRQSGTYWYHAHSGFQEQQGLYGPLIIRPRDPEPFAYDREHVVLLSDWTDRDPLDLYRLLKRQPGYFNYNDRTLGRFVRDSQRDGLKATWRERLEWGRMRMKPSDLADVGGNGYTFLMNGVTPAGNWTGLFVPGERVRLRFINGSAMSIFDVRIPGLDMTVVAADGQNVEPVRVEEFRISAAETLDVIVEPRAEEAYTVFAQSMDRAGFACGTLAVREGARAAVPALDPVEYLSMADMGHAGHENVAAMPAAMDHSAHEATPAVIDHSAHAAAPAATDHSAHAAPAAAAQTHPASESGNPGVDMQAAAPAPRLDDPGVGLRANGRRVLTYADLKSAFPDPDGRVPERTIELHRRATWSASCGRSTAFCSRLPSRLSSSSASASASCSSTTR